MKKDTRIIIGICIVFLFAAGILFWRQQSLTADSSYQQNLSFEPYSSPVAGLSEKSVDSPEDTTDVGSRCDEYAVYVSGAVKKPGLFRYSRTARVYDAIQSAGGFRKKADRDAVNLAQPLTDGEQIHVPYRTPKSSEKTADTATKNHTTEEQLININTASLEELMTLPGIGEAKAGSIIAYRKQHGFFSKKEDLMEISGIKEGVYNKIKNFIVIT